LYVVRNNDPNVEPTLVILYSDDFDIVGPDEDAIYDKLAKLVMFDHHSHEEASNMDDIIGMEFFQDVPDAAGRNRMVMHQAGYAQHIVKEFEDKHNGGHPLKPLYTPMEAREERGHEEQQGILEAPESVPSWIPDVSASKEEHGGKFGWLGRGSRPDICVAQRKISTRYHIWSRVDDKLVYRLYQYIKATYMLGMGFWAHPKDYFTMLISLRTDSDHANDTTTAKSMSGGRLALRGALGTYIPLSWWARRQGATSRNTGEAETGSLDEGVFQEAIPTQGILEDVLLRPVRVIAEMDNSAAIGAVSRGFSRKLAYMKKWRRVSLSALHEYFYGDNPERTGDDDYSYNRLYHRAGDRNDSDLMTKAFAYARHWELVRMIGMRAVPQEALEQREKVKAQKK
jgi:hypothetical protein